MSHITSTGRRLSLNQKHAHYANRRERAFCELSVKTIEAEKLSSQLQHDREFGNYLSRLAHYSSAVAKQAEETHGEVRDSSLGASGEPYVKKTEKDKPLNSSWLSGAPGRRRSTLF